MPKTGVHKISRKCLVCGKRMSIIVNKDRHYHGGHYFNKLKIPIKGTGKYRKVGKTKLGKLMVDVVKWTGKEKEIEYWECNKCYEEASHEGWLEEILEKLFGKKCREYEKGCACCEAWSVYDTIVDANRGRL